MTATNQSLLSQWDCWQRFRVTDTQRATCCWDTHYSQRERRIRVTTHIRRWKGWKLLRGRAQREREIETYCVQPGEAEQWQTHPYCDWMRAQWMLAAKNQRGREKWGNEQCKIGRRNKRKRWRDKIKKREVKANQLLLKQRVKNTWDRMDSLGQIAQWVSVCEKGIILQSHERESGELYPSSNRHTKEITVQLHAKRVTNVQQRAL